MGNYTKQNFRAGEVLRASQLNAMDAILEQLANNQGSGSGSGGSLDIHYTPEQIETILDYVKQTLYIPLISNEYDIHLDIPEWLEQYLFANSSTYLNEIIDNTVDIMQYLPLNWMQTIDTYVSGEDKLNLYINNNFYKSYVGFEVAGTGDIGLTLFIPEDNYISIVQAAMASMSGSDNIMSDNELYDMLGKVLILSMKNGDEFMSVITFTPYNCILTKLNYSDTINISSSGVLALNWIESICNNFGETYPSNFFNLSAYCKIAKNGYSVRQPSSCQFTGWPWELEFDVTDIADGMLCGKSYVHFMKNNETYHAEFLTDKDIFIDINAFKEFNDRISALENNN